MHDIKSPMQSLLANATHRLATCWLVERTDGVTLGFTDHDRQLVLNGVEYNPGGSFSASARQRLEGTTPMNLETRAAISSAAITEADLYAGRYRQAKITEFTTDWKFPFGYFIRSIYYIEETKFDGEVWQASLSGILIRLRQVIGDLHHKLCRFDLGDSDCGINLALHTVSDSVSGVAIPRLAITTTRTEADDWFVDGKLTWGTGLNTGTTSEVKLFAGGAFEFYVETLSEIQVGDQFTVYPGCQKRFEEDCKEKFSNQNNHGGFDDIPGNDDFMETPDAQ